MSWWSRFRLRRRKDDIAEEIATHLAMATRERIERGESPEEARFAALREFGNVGLIEDTTRRVWISVVVEQFVQDLRFGARILWHSPGLSATAVILVALVIGGNTTIYSVVHGLLVNPAAGVEAENLVVIEQVSAESAMLGPYTSYPNFLDYVSQVTTVRQLAGWSDERLALGLGDGSYAVFGGLVTSGYFDTLGLRMARGRGFRADDDQASADALAAVISHRLWRDRFQEAADIIGRAVSVNGKIATIVGVAPPRFLGATLTPGEDVWLPITAYYSAIGSQHLLRDRRQPMIVIAGQLAPGRSLEETQAELAALSAQLETAYPTDNKARRATVSNYSATALLLVGRVAPQFLAVFSIVTMLTLLIVSANVANLMLARAVVRQRETAVRQSLGASRLRIIRMLIAEGAAVSLAAWFAACVFAWWVSRALVGFLEPARRGLMPDFRPDWQVAAYAMVLAMLATMAFTMAPAFRTWRQQVLPWLKAGEQAVAQGRSRLSSALVVLQLAFCVVLLTSAGLAYRSLDMLDTGDIGFTSDNIVVVTVRTDRSGAFVDTQPSPAERDAAFALLERLRERLAAVPNVETVSYTRRSIGAFRAVGSPVTRAGLNDPVSALTRPVGPDYLEVLGLAPVAGRAMGPQDRRGAHRTALVNKHLADVLWPHGSAVGQTLLVGSQKEPVEIVGVTPNALFDGPAYDPRPNFVLLSEQQMTGAAVAEPKFLVRYRGSLESVAPALRKAVADVDPQVPVVSVETMTAQLATVAELERLVASLLFFFAVGSLVVAVLGQYAIAAFSMRRRTRDFGVRLALGASAQQIQGAVVAESLRLTALGLAVGFALSVALGVAARNVLIGVTPTDPPTYLAVFVVLAVASIIASYLPAWRAGRVNVIQALRQE